MAVKIQVRRMSTSNWQVTPATDPITYKILDVGELGLDTTTGELKLGDGTTRFNLLTPLSALAFVPEDTHMKDHASGYAGLDVNSKLAAAQLPAIAITDTYVVADEAAMLALADTVQIGDVAVNQELSKSFIVADDEIVGQGTIGGNIANWVELLSPTHEALLDGKADLAVPAAAGNFATLTTLGNLADSTYSVSDFALHDHNHDSDYAADDHNHDLDYAADDHNHDSAYEAVLGDPGTDGLFLSSLADGTRSWVSVDGGTDRKSVV